VQVNDLGQGFTIDEDLLTPTLKLRRPQLQLKYQKVSGRARVEMARGACV